ncbi:MAG: FAD-binding oxidoreductase [Promethearchaeota archaeon]
MHHPLYESLAGIVGSRNVSDEKHSLYAVFADAGIERGSLSGIIVHPKTTEEVVLIVKLANRTNTPITVRGGGSGMPGGSAPFIPGGLLLETTEMNKIIEINEDKFIATVQGGVTHGKLVTEVHKMGLDLCLGGHNIYAATFGGSVSNLTYPIGAGRFGAYGEEILNLEVVLPTGDVIRTGSDCTTVGGRFHRYGAGPDLTGMFIGDQGVLGIKTEVTVRLYYPPETRAFESYYFNTLEEATEACIEMGKRWSFFDGLLVVGEHSVRQLPPDTLKKYNIPEGTEGVMHISLEGDEATIDHQKAKVDKIAERYNGTKLGPDISKITTYDLMGDHASKIRSFGVSGPINGFIPTYKLPKVSRDVDKMLSDHEHLLLTLPGREKKAWLNAAFMMRGPVVNYACRPSFVSDPPEVREEAVDFWHELVKYIANQGSCPYWIGRAWTPAITPLYRPAYYMFFKTLKQTFDPNNILNPGIFQF